MEHRNIIYALRDPRTDDYMYVGKSTVGLKRPMAHFTHSHNPLVRNWVLDLASYEHEPIIDILEHCDDKFKLEKREKFWIDTLLSEEHPLLNTQLYIGPKSTVAEKREEIELLKKKLDKEIGNIKHQIETNKTYTIDDISKMILNRRKFAKLSRNKLAEIAGVGKTVIYDIENGKESVRLDTLRKVLNVLSIEFVFYYREDYKKKQGRGYVPALSVTGSLLSAIFWLPVILSL